MRLGRKDGAGVRGKLARARVATVVRMSRLFRRKSSGAASGEIDIATDAVIVPDDIDNLTKAQVVEAIVASGRQDQESVIALIESLLEAELQVPMGLDSEGQPAMGAVMSEVEGVVYMAVFTSLDAAAHVIDMSHEFSTMLGKQVIGTMRTDLGLVVETGVGKFGLIPPMLASIKATVVSREVSSSLETLANRVRSGSAGIDELVDALMVSTVVVPTPDEPKGGGGFTPVIGSVNGSPRLVVAASFEAASRSRDVAEFAMSIEGKYLFAIVKDGVGIQLNTLVGAVDLPPELCAAVVKKYSLERNSTAPTN